MRQKNLNYQRKPEKYRMYKRFKYFEAITNGKISEIENLEEHTVSIYRIIKQIEQMSQL